MAQSRTVKSLTKVPRSFPLSPVIDLKALLEFKSTLMFRGTIINAFRNFRIFGMKTEQNVLSKAVVQKYWKKINVFTVLN